MEREIRRRDFFRWATMAGAFIASGKETSAQSPTPPPIVAQTVSGSVSGIVNNGVSVFHAIPYAAPPVGALRFGAPGDPTPWQGVRNCTRIGPSAPQGASRLDGVMGVLPPFEQSEDCLTLSVWTPAPDSARRPVFVWLHGGAYVTGGGDLPFYSGSTLARTGDIVVVNVNYRLGALGYLHLPGIDGKGGATANGGLLDQVQALRWVRDNVAAFGGDPANITIGGQSAGGSSVLALLAMPEARKMIRRAIVQSPVAKTLSVDRARQVTQQFLSAIGIPGVDLAKLRELSASAILDAQLTVQARIAASGDLSLPFQIVTGSSDTPVEPGDAVASGAASAIPLLIGTTRDEVRAWLGQDSKMLEATNWDIVEKLYGMAGVAAPFGYSYAKWKAGDEKPWQVLSAMATNATFLKPVITIADGHASHGGEAYVYRFDWRPSPGALFGACHSIELPFVFNNLSDWPASPMLAGFDPSSFRTLAATVQGMWLSFIRSGKPSAAGSPAWPSRSASHRQCLIFDTEVRMVDD